MELTVGLPGSDVSLLHLAGRMDPHATQQVKARLRSETAERDRPAVVDLSGVTFITSLGVGVLVDVGVTVQKAGHRFVLVAPPGLVRTVLEKTGVDRIFVFAESVESALEMIDA